MKINEIKSIIILLTFMLISALPTFTFAKIKSCYTYLGCGAPIRMNYPVEFENSLDIENYRGKDSRVYVDLLGYYQPLSNKIIVGGILNTIEDKYECPDGDKTIQQNSLSASAMYFYGLEIGYGFFLRSDIGIASVREGHYSIPEWFSTEREFTEKKKSNIGIAFLLGGGYSFPITTNTRILLNLNYAVKYIERESYKTLNLSIGGLYFLRFSKLLEKK